MEKSLTDIAEKAIETPFQVATNTKNPKICPAVANVHPAVEHKVKITTMEATPQLTIDNIIMLSINEAMNGQYRFMLGKATSKNKIIQQAPTDSDMSAALRFDSETGNGLSKFGIMATENIANSKIS